ncbi:MAG TPA: EAL domain-containing protein [Alphaproteobacteria bacterium]|nr:EAL domain-containing protein [Alphaproteobacteria bacterium]
MPNRLKKHGVQSELELLRNALAGSGDLAYDWDLTTDTISWSGRVTHVFGISSATQINAGPHFHRLINPEDLLIRRRAFSEHVASGIPFDCEYRIRGDGGEMVWVHERGAASLSTVGEPERLAGTLRVITERKTNETRLEYQANYDEMTGHFNESRLREALEQSMAYGRRYGVQGAYLQVAIDTLAMIHDAYEGPTADTAVLTLGQRIERNIRASDIVGRVAVDSFGIVTSNCPGDTISTIANKLLAVCHDTPVVTASGPIHVKVSIGGVIFPEIGQTAHDVMTQAEVARREARERQGLPFVHYKCSEEQRRDSHEHVEIGERVMRALRSNRLVFAYQPIVEARGYAVKHHECLIRMIERDGSITPAAKFMPVIEQLGLIRDVDRYVLETAVRELHEHTDASYAINVSALTANDRSWLRLLFALLRNAGSVAERMIIEITETVALQDIEETANFVAQVRDLGCQVALDDFGAGYTSFRHLKSLAVDTVKIDGSFVRGIAQNVDNQLFVRTLLGLANGFGLGTIAECVEDQADADALAEEGVDLLQGYFFGVPTIEPPWEKKAPADKTKVEPFEPRSAAG